MEIIKDKFIHDFKIENYFNGKTCFFDIETTGLNRNKDVIYLIGLLYFDSVDKTWVLKQYFANSVDKEADMLISFVKDINSFDTIITYNGDSFDIPFVNNKLSTYNSNIIIDRKKSFDLYRFIRSNRHFLNLKNLKLKTIEESLGYFREDIYSGYDCINFYKDFLKTADPIMKNRVLQHNHDDLVHMLDIMEIIDIINDKKTIQLDNNKLLLESFSIKKDKLLLNGTIEPELVFKIVDYNLNYSFTTETKNSFHASIDVQKGLINSETTACFVSLNSLGLEKLKSKYQEKYSLIDDVYIISIGQELLVDEIMRLLKSLVQTKY